MGEGGKKRVYLAHDTLLDRDVAFALIKTEGLDEVGRDRIKREAQAMGRLGAHPHIVSVFDLGEEPAEGTGSRQQATGHVSPAVGAGLVPAPGQPYIVTELIGGGDVEGLIEKAPGHRPPFEQTLKLGIEVCRGLEFAHSHGIVHRDLQPGNVWLTESYQPTAVSVQPAGQGATGNPLSLAGAGDGEGETPAPVRRRAAPEGPVAKLGDFGLAVALGTVAYIPPEQAMGGEVTPRSDLYSLGAMLYELLTGRPPFVGDESVAIITQHLNTAPVSPPWHNPELPPALETLILRLLEKDPTKRPASAGEAREALRSYVLAREPDGLKQDRVGCGALGDRRPQEQRWRLLQAVGGFLGSASRVQPLLVILEYLHDADRGTLDPRLHLARNRAGARLLIVGTYLTRVRRLSVTSP